MIVKGNHQLHGSQLFVYDFVDDLWPWAVASISEFSRAARPASGE